MKKYVSYEMIISALLANYKRTILVKEVLSFTNEYLSSRSNTKLAMDGFPNIGKYIGHYDEYIWLQGHLEDIVEDNMTLKEYLNNIAGQELKNATECLGNENEFRSRR